MLADCGVAVRRSGRAVQAALGLARPGPAPCALVLAGATGRVQGTHPIDG